MNRKRLERLRDALRDERLVSRVHFDMGMWGTSRNREKATARTINTVRPECGFAACALGFAALLPDFRKAGLRMVEWQEYPQIPEQGIVRLLVTFTPRNKTQRTLEGFDAGERFFSISKAASNWLFDPDHYPDDTETWDDDFPVVVTPEWVANRIDRLLTEGDDAVPGYLYDVHGWPDED